MTYTVAGEPAAAVESWSKSLLRIWQSVVGAPIPASPIPAGVAISPGEMSTIVLPGDDARSAVFSVCIARCARHTMSPAVSDWEPSPTNFVIVSVSAAGAEAGDSMPPWRRLIRLKRSVAAAFDVSCPTALRTGSSRPAAMPSSSRMMRNSRPPGAPAASLAALVENGAGRFDGFGFGAAAAGGAPPVGTLTSVRLWIFRSRPSVRIVTSSAFRSATGCPVLVSARTTICAARAGFGAACLGASPRGFLAWAEAVATVKASQASTGRQRKIIARIAFTSGKKPEADSIAARAPFEKGWSIAVRSPRAGLRTRGLANPDGRRGPHRHVRTADAQVHPLRAHGGLLVGGERGAVIAGRRRDGARQRAGVGPRHESREPARVAGERIERP